MYWQVVTLTSDFHVEFAIHGKILSRNTAWILHLPIKYCITEYKKTNKQAQIVKSIEQIYAHDISI